MNKNKLTEEEVEQSLLKEMMPTSSTVTFGVRNDLEITEEVKNFIGKTVAIAIQSIIDELEANAKARGSETVTMKDVKKSFMQKQEGQQ